MITIHSKLKETLIQAIRRAEKNAQAYSRIITLNYQGIQGLIYPKENLANAMKYFKIELVKAQIAALS